MLGLDRRILQAILRAINRMADSQERLAAALEENSALRREELACEGKSR